MTNVRIVHTADLHLGAHFTSTPEIAAKRRMEQLENLGKIIDICHERNAAALLIAGDLFDSVRTERQLLTEVQRMLGESGVWVYITPGNHDPATPDSSYNDEGWPDNVYIFKKGLECVEIPDTGACVWGLGFHHANEVESLLPNFAPKDMMINILLMHAEVVPDDKAESRYNPITPERLVSLGVDYCALGHIHKSSFTKVGEFAYCSCGCPSGRGFDEQGDKGVYAGIVGRHFVYMEYQSTGSRKYLSEKIEVSGCETSDDFCAKISEAIEKSVGEGWQENIYDVLLLGALPKGILPDIQTIAKKMMDVVHYIRITDMTTAELDLDLLMKDNSLRGAFVRTVVSQMEKDERNRLRYMRALLYGLRAFDGEVRIHEDY